MEFTFLDVLIKGGIAFLWIIGLLVPALFILRVFLSWRKSRELDFQRGPSAWVDDFDPDVYETADEMRRSVHFDDVDFGSDIYAEAEKKNAVDLKKFKTQSKEAITKYYCELAATERQVEWTAEASRKKERITQQHNRRKVKELFKDGWIHWIAKELRIEDYDYDGYIDLFNVVSAVYVAADRQFGGAMPIKKTWSLAQKMNVPFFAQNRHFWEVVTEILGRKGLLQGGYGRAGRRMTENGRNEIAALKAAVDAVKMSRPAEKIS